VRNKSETRVFERPRFALAKLAILIDLFLWHTGCHGEKACLVTHDSHFASVPLAKAQRLMHFSKLMHFSDVRNR
jgi:hypothetical protein